MLGSAVLCLEEVTRLAWKKTSFSAESTTSPRFMLPEILGGNDEAKLSVIGVVALHEATIHLTYLLLQPHHECVALGREYLDLRCRQ